jgi:hypothetical protein
MSVPSPRVKNSKKKLGCPETLVVNYQCGLHNNPEAAISHVLGGSTFLFQGEKWLNPVTPNDL